MKKLTILSLLIMLALLVVACEPAETEPGLGTPGTPLDTPVGPVETPVEPLVPTATVLVPDETTVAPVETAVAPDETPVAVDDPDNSPRRASNLMGVQVRNYEEDTIGEVDEMILSLNEGEGIAYAIVGVGGFLGIGERNVAVPFEALELVRDTDDPDDYAFYIDANQEQLESLPDVDYNELDFTIPDWDVDFRTAWQDGVIIVTDEEETDAAATPVNEGEEDTDGDADLPTENEAVASGDVFRNARAVRVSELLGSTVYSDIVERTSADPAVPADPAQPADPGQSGTPADPAVPADPAQPADPSLVDDYPRNAERLGHVEDLIVDYETGMVEYAIVEADNALDLTDPWIPVPLQALNIMVEGFDTYVGVTTDYLVQVDREQLVAAPGFEVGVLPIVEDPDWDTGVREYWLTQ